MCEDFAVTVSQGHQSTQLSELVIKDTGVASFCSAVDSEWRSGQFRARVAPSAFGAAPRRACTFFQSVARGESWWKLAELQMTFAAVKAEAPWPPPVFRPKSDDFGAAGAAAAARA